jgi:hypothetical protein
MVKHSAFFYFLWVAPLVLEIFIVWILLRRRLYREFPAFSLYSAFQPVHGFFMLAIHHDRRVSNEAYYFLYLLFMAINATFRFAIIREIYLHLFRPYRGMVDLGRGLFRWVALVLVVIAVIVAVYAPAYDEWPLLSKVFLLDRTVSIIQCGLLLFLFLFASHFGLSFRNYAFGIALGLGLVGSVELAVAAIQSHVGRIWINIINYITMGAFNVGALIWLGYLLAPQPVTRVVAVAPDGDLQQWNESLRRLLR